MALQKHIIEIQCKRCLPSGKVDVLVSGGSKISPRWGREPSGGGRRTHNFAKFSHKLHEIEISNISEGMVVQQGACEGIFGCAGMRGSSFIRSSCSMGNKFFGFKE